MSDQVVGIIERGPRGPAVAQEQIDAAVEAIVGGAPGALDTLNELAAALGDDPSFAGTVTTALAAKATSAALATEVSRATAAEGALDTRLDVVEPLTPSSGQKDALAGGGGTPGASNKYETKQSADARHASGLLAARPAAATFGVGFYYATDDNGGNLYHSDASTWRTASPRGVTLSRLVTTSSIITLSNTSFADLAGQTITFTPTRAVPILLEFWTPKLSVGGTFAAGGILVVNTRLVDGSGTDLTGTMVWYGRANLEASPPITIRRWLEPGDFTVGVPMTVKAQSQQTAVSVTSGLHAIGGRMHLRAVEEV